MTKAKDKSVPRTVAEADERGHAKIAMPSKAKMAKGHSLSITNAQPGDVAYVGPCENGQKTVCYYDARMLPSDCRQQDC